MIICHIITAFDFGGAERLLVNTVNLQKKNHKVHIIYLKGEAKLASLLDSEIELHYIPLSISCASKIRAYLKKLQPQVVHTHLGHADLIGLYASRNLPLWQFCTMHNVWFKFNQIDRFIFLCYKLLFYVYAPNCIVTGVSEAIVKHIEKNLGVKKFNIYYIPNSIPIKIIHQDKINLRKELNITSNVFTILFIGRLRLQKSVDTLIEAASILKNTIKNFKVIILGEGPLEGSLKSKAKELGLIELIEFRGVSLNPDKFLIACDVFVLPSVFEGLPTVILEAFRAKIPVVASNIDGSKDLIHHHENGLLFKPLSSIDLAEKISLLYHNINFRKKLGDEGFKVFTDKYTINKYVLEMEKLYLSQNNKIR